MDPMHTATTTLCTRKQGRLTGPTCHTTRGTHLVTMMIADGTFRPGFEEAMDFMYVLTACLALQNRAETYHHQSSYKVSSPVVWQVGPVSRPCTCCGTHQGTWTAARWRRRGVRTNEGPSDDKNWRVSDEWVRKG